MGLEANQAEDARLAIVIATAVPGAAPHGRLAGLSLALRTVLTLQKDGATRVLLVVDEGDAKTAAAVRADKRVKLPIDETTPDGLKSKAKTLTSPALVAMHDVVVDPAIYRALREAPRSGDEAIAATSGGERVGPLLAGPKVIARLDVGAGRDASLGLSSNDIVPLDVAGRWHARVSTKEGKKQAFNALFEACRKPVDGIVARHINRHISIFVSKRIVGTPITPNQMSIITFLLAVAATYCVAVGSYAYVLLGAFLLQWNSILDGVDGELARVRFQHSKVGQWLDTVSDDVSNLLFYWGLGVGAANLWLGPWLMIAAYIAIGATVVARGLEYAEMAALGTGDLYAIEWGFDKAPPKGFAGKLLVFFRLTLKKDFAILFFLVVALFGVLPYALPIAAGGAIGALIATLGRRRAIRRAAAAAG